MRTLVAGGAGFIGSHLCDRLLADGHEVFAVDNLITGNLENLSHLEGDSRFHFLEHDIALAVPDLAVDAVFHLASPASPPGYLQYPVKTALANSAGTYNLLELSRRRNATFLMASTSEIYGEPLVHPQKEEHWGNVNPVGMRACYDESKRFAEMMTSTYRRHYQLDTRIIRIFNTYGPRSDPDDGRLVPNFVTQALLNKPITVYGDGTQTRSLCYVSDLVEGIVRAMFYQNTTGAILNLGNPEEHTVGEYAEIIRELSGSESPTVYLPKPSEDDPTRRRPDIGRARTALGWDPQVHLLDGLKSTIEWFRQRLDVR